MAKFTTIKNQECGIALGGLGTGSVELFPDGEFHLWQIANNEKWGAPLNGTNASDGEEHTGALSFWVRTEAEGETPIVRKLGMQTAEKDFRYAMFAWNKPIEAIEFEGKFPVAKLTYRDGKLPIDLSMKAIAPFVPHDEKASATPGFYLDLDLTNPTDKPITVSLLSLLRPTFCNSGVSHNRHFVEGTRSGVFLDSPEPSDKADHGSLCYSVEGGEVSFVTAEYTKYSRCALFYSSLGITEESLLFNFRKNGVLPNTTVGTPPAEIEKEIGELTDEELSCYTEKMLAYPFARSIYDRVRYVKPAFLESRRDKEEFLTACKRAKDRLGREFGTCALCSKLTLAPRESRTVRFILSWYFPNHYSQNGALLGHYYENHFKDAAEVNRYLAKERENIADKASDFAKLLYKTDLPESYPDSWSGQLAMLVKDSWYLKDGKFALWEGFSSCGFHTTDITYQASFGLLALFPRLQLGQMEMGAKFQREDGCVHHFFTPDLDHVDNGYDRVDMNNQFVLLVCRDYLYTGDEAYLERMWLPVQKAMDSIERLDADKDGLPDEGTRRNTYDAWNFSGTPAYISILWLSALKAAISIAEALGEDTRKHQWEALLAKGLASLEKRLWNGKYYDLWCRDTESGRVVDRSLMTDQISGEWFLRAAGIGGVLDDERVRCVLKTVFAHNFDDNYGLVNATCLKGEPVSLDTYENCQAVIVWTGIGYTVASLALAVAATSDGMTEIAHAIVENIHQNQLRCGMLWNHEESGFRYTRPLSSFTTMTAALGLSLNAKEKKLAFSPYCDTVIAPFCTCQHLGYVTCKDGICEITLQKGSLEGWEITAEKNGKAFEVVITA